MWQWHIVASSHWSIDYCFLTRKPWIKARTHKINDANVSAWMLLYFQTSLHCFVWLPGGWQVIFQKNPANEIHHIWQPLKGGLRPRWSVPIAPLIILESLFSFFLASPQCDCDRGASTSHWTAAETEWLSLTIAVIRINPQSGNTIRGPQQRYTVVVERSEELRHKKNRFERDVRVKIHLLWAKATFKNIFTAHFFFTTVQHDVNPSGISI